MEGRVALAADPVNPTGVVAEAGANFPSVKRRSNVSSSSVISVFRASRLCGNVGIAPTDDSTALRTTRGPPKFPFLSRSAPTKISRVQRPKFARGMRRKFTEFKAAAISRPRAAVHRFYSTKRTTTRTPRHARKECFELFSNFRKLPKVKIDH